MLKKLIRLVKKDFSEHDKIFKHLALLTSDKEVAEHNITKYKKNKWDAIFKGDVAFIKLYLSWEDFIINQTKISKEDLRKDIADKVNIKSLDNSFQVFFLDERSQLLNLYESMVIKLSEYIQQNLGFKAYKEIFQKSAQGSIFENVKISKQNIDFAHMNSIVAQRHSEYDRNTITELFNSFITSLYNKIELSLGSKIIQSLFQKLYENFRKTYNAEYTTWLLKITPEKILELDQWLSVLSRDELEKEVKEKTRELEYLNSSLEKKVSDRTRELQEAYEDLKKLDQQKSDFISVAAHQIRTPLSGIKWTINMLLGEDSENLNSEQKEFLQKAYNANEKLLMIVNDMLDTDLISKGKAVYDFKKVDIYQVIKQSISEASISAQAKNINLSWEKDGGNNGFIECDKKRIQSVIQNLLDNAIKYSPQDSEVLIKSEKDEKHLILKIIDHGIGIPEDQKMDIFKRFFRARNSVRTHANGSGLGLFIAKSIILEHNGSINFTSQEGLGTTFIVKLPIQQTNATNI